jgi:hypothetical protein
VKITTEEADSLGLNIKDVSAKNWSYYREIDLCHDILMIILKINHEYAETHVGKVYDRIYQIGWDIKQFLKTDGTVIVLLSGRRTIEIEREREQTMK